MARRPHSGETPCRSRLQKRGRMRTAITRHLSGIRVQLPQAGAVVWVCDSLAIPGARETRQEEVDRGQTRRWCPRDSPSAGVLSRATPL